MSGFPVPTKAPEGPFYIDTESCQCTLRLFNQTAVQLQGKKADGEEAWRCIGDTSGDPYTGENGKWFLPSKPVNNGGESTNDVRQPFDWAGNPPDLGKTYIVDNTTYDFQPLDDTDASQLSMVDAACSGQNSSDQSSRYYGAVRQVEDGQQPTEATLCYPGTHSVELQDADAWTTHGCNLGFFCKRSL